MRGDPLAPTRLRRPFPPMRAKIHGGSRRHPEPVAGDEQHRRGWRAKQQLAEENKRPLIDGLDETALEQPVGPRKGSLENVRQWENL